MFEDLPLPGHNQLGDLKKNPFSVKVSINVGIICYHFKFVLGDHSEAWNSIVLETLGVNQSPNIVKIINPVRLQYKFGFLIVSRRCLLESGS